MTRDRGQLVVLAAAAIAIALVPMTLAYLQLGYHADVQTSTTDGDDTLPTVERTLGRTLDSASADVPAGYSWSARSAAVTTLRDRLRPTLQSLRSSSLDAGKTVQITYNDTRAHAWASANCPVGPNRDFGPCRADRGVVVQERVDRTHVLAVAFDTTVTAPEQTVQATVIVETLDSG